MDKLMFTGRSANKYGQSQLHMASTTWTKPLPPPIAAAMDIGSEKILKDTQSRPIYT